MICYDQNKDQLVVRQTYFEISLIKVRVGSGVFRLLKYYLQLGYIGHCEARRFRAPPHCFGIGKKNYSPTHNFKKIRENGVIGTQSAILKLLPTVYTFQGKTEKSETENTIKRIITQDTDVSNGKTDMPEICVDESIPALPRTDVEMFLQGLSQGM